MKTFHIRVSEPCTRSIVVHIKHIGNDALRTENAQLREELSLKAKKLKELSNSDALENMYQVGLEQERTIMSLEAELAAIREQKPVAYRWVWKSKPNDIEGWCYTDAAYPPKHPELQEIQMLYGAQGEKA